VLSTWGTELAHQERFGSFNLKCGDVRNSEIQVTCVRMKTAAWLLLLAVCINVMKNQKGVAEAWCTMRQMMTKYVTLRRGLGRNTGLGMKPRAYHCRH